MTVLSRAVSGHVSSMTGFAQAAGTCGRSRWTWDIRSVNAKGLDLRLRLPAGLDALDIDARRRIGGRLTRGTCHASLTVTREAAAARPRIDKDALNALIRELVAIERPPAVGPATLDGLLAIRGIVETAEETLDSSELALVTAACASGLDAALDGLVRMRADEGAALKSILEDRLTAIGRLTQSADNAPQRQPEAIKEKLAQAIAALAERFALDHDRLHQEAVILAAKADVREELDRLAAHVAAARELIAAGGPIGRRLDFLAQEFGREASTFCAKANDSALTAIGLELRVEIEQFREQVQNIE